MEPKAMASIGFCPLAKQVGEWRIEDRSAGRGIARPARSAAQEGRGNPADRQARPLAAETVQSLRQGAGTGPKNPNEQPRRPGPPRSDRKRRGALAGEPRHHPM